MAKITKKKPTAVSKSGDRWRHCFDISGSTGTVYRISFDTAQMCWVCSCRGCIRWGQCKHLTACGLEGRKFGKQKTIPTTKPAVRSLPSY